MLRRGDTTIAIWAAAIFLLASLRVSGQTKTNFDLETATISDINHAMDEGALSSEQLVRLSLARIKAYDSLLHAVITVNPNAIEEAKVLDAERRTKGPRSPLHGVPVLVKDNIDTRDLATTLGFYGLKGAVPYADAEVVAKLRAAGAIVLAKVNLSELASGPAMSSLGGQTHNPHDLEYSPAGSSSGSAVGVAAGYAPVAVGTDTAGSVRWPAATNGVVGLKPTTGIISSIGVMPSAPTLDTVGPIARSVADVAVVTSILEDVDVRDAKARDRDGTYPAHPLAMLRTDGLKAARIGYLRHDFAGDDKEVDSVMSMAIEKLKAAGATVVEVQIPFWLVHFQGDLQSLIVRTEAAPSLNAYLLSSFPPGYPRTHADILAMSKRLTAPTADGMLPNPGRLALYIGEEATPPATNPNYVAAKNEGLAFVAASLEACLAIDHLDALVYPTSTSRIEKIGEPARANARGLYSNWGTTLASLTGWPDLTVPAGTTSDGLPVGISFMGPRFSDMKLLGYGYAFEQATHALRQPITTPPLKGDHFQY